MLNKFDGLLGEIRQDLCSENCKMAVLLVLASGCSAVNWMTTDTKGAEMNFKDREMQQTQKTASVTTRRRGPIPYRFATGIVAATLATSGALLLGAPAASAAGSYQTTGTVNVRNGAGTGSGIVGSRPPGAGFYLDCQAQDSTNINGNRTWDRVRFNDGLVGWIADYWTTTPSYNNFAPGTGSCPTATTAQMQRAVTWAMSEKNSPDPTWSDHYGHAWSGWCEQFVEQAEGFTRPFDSANNHYQWQANSGRIHTDTNPPAGALVFYGGGNGNGHVAVSIGNGQAIGTLGYVGDRKPVSQYPVIGYLSNYRGWANPIGS